MVSGGCTPGLRFDYNLPWRKRLQGSWSGMCIVPAQPVRKILIVSGVDGFAAYS
jgi:hypothetical protein